MTKRKLKKALAVRQEGFSALSGDLLDTNLSLTDTDRRIPKADGGTYDNLDNVRLVKPVEHMRRHGNLRDRGPEHDVLKSIFDDRVQMMALLLGENNRLLAYERRTDSKNKETSEFLQEHIKPIQQRIANIDKTLAAALTLVAKKDALPRIALEVPGLGPVTVAALTVYIDFHKMVCSHCHRSLKAEDAEGDTHQEKTLYCKCKEVTLVHAASTPSSLWKYVGLHCASHERYVKGEAGGGNKTLRTVLYNTACVMMKMSDGEYRKVYDQTKLRLSHSEKVVKTRNTQGKMVELPWKDTKPSHRHGAALRAIIKHLLADYWYVGRTLAGLPTVPLYAEAMLGHTHIIDPRERGWKF